MRPRYLPLLTLLVASLSTPSLAQQAQPVFGGVVGGVVVAPAPLTKATPDTVVARLMSFDRDGDGRIVMGELPERMQTLLTRGDSSNDGALDRAEVRQLAVSPTQLPIRNGFQLGQYGIFDNGFDTSRLEDALDDLRLTANTKEKAIELAHKFQDDLDTKAREDVLSVMSRLLSVEQLEDFRGTVGGRMVNVTAILRDGVTIFGATAAEMAGQQRVTVRLREDATGNPVAYIQKYHLSADQQRQALDAIRQFRLHRPGRLNDTEHLQLMEQLRGVLSDEQRDDLRAALGRRPVVKLAGGSGTITIEQLLQQQLQRLRPNPEPAETFQFQDLLLRR